MSEIRTVGLVDDTVCSIKCCSPHTKKVADNWFYLVSIMSAVLWITWYVSPGEAACYYEMRDFFYGYQRVLAN